ncbi:MAG: DUF6494 family protein [Gammaproteobacteria bacterium]|nr:DUF6494 family protein [Gammaproteobacteria bacterium]
MDEEVMNLQIRKFLKRVGITAQREIEKAVRDGLDSGILSGTETLSTRMTLTVPQLSMDINIDGDISLE